MTFLVGLHNLVRWVVVIAGVLAAAKAILGLVNKQSWGARDNRLGMIFTISFDIQFLLGLILYVAGPTMQAVWGDFGGAMSVDGLRFFAVEHIFMMILGLGMAHMGRSLAKKAPTDAKKHQRAAIFFSLSLLLLFMGIPWSSRPLIPFR